MPRTPDRHFLPSPGRIRRLVEPQGPGIRVDSGVYDGWEVPVHYDPMIAKLVAHGADRPQAIARMKRALREYRIDGIKTNLSFFAALLADPAFVAGEFSTGFIDEFLRRHPGHADDGDLPFDAIATVSALAYRDAQQPASTDGGVRPRTDSPWKTSLRPGVHNPRRRF
jgi:acetyl-CoA carboxylase, biotin carboxylase subunit